MVICDEYYITSTLDNLITNTDIIFGAWLKADTFAQNPLTEVYGVFSLGIDGGGGGLLFRRELGDEQVLLADDRLRLVLRRELQRHAVGLHPVGRGHQHFVPGIEQRIHAHDDQFGCAIAKINVVNGDAIDFLFLAVVHDRLTGREQALGVGIASGVDIIDSLL